MLDDLLLDRAAGCLVGMAVGDALGAPYEFKIPGPDEPEMRGGGIGPWEPGEWTDDTQLAICVAQGRARPLDVGARFLAWFENGPKDVGVQTRAVLRAARRPDELGTRWVRTQPCDGRVSLRGVIWRGDLEHMVVDDRPVSGGRISPRLGTPRSALRGTADSVGC